MRAISPKKPLGPTVSTTRSPTFNSTSPLLTTYMESPDSPVEKMTVPAGKDKGSVESSKMLGNFMDEDVVLEVGLTSDVFVTKPRSGSEERQKWVLNRTDDARAKRERTFSQEIVRNFVQRFEV